jgi:hypothetical protein
MLRPDARHSLLVWRRKVRERMCCLASWSIFRRIDRWSNVDRRTPTPQPANPILKDRREQAGLDPEVFSAHEPRCGYLTEAANCGIPFAGGDEATRA